MIGVTVGAVSMNATEMTGLLRANVVTGDADRILTSVEAILSMGGEAAGGTLQADLLGALQVASEAMEPTAESMEALATIVGDVALMGITNEILGENYKKPMFLMSSLGQGTPLFQDRPCLHIHAAAPADPGGWDRLPGSACGHIDPWPCGSAVSCRRGLSWVTWYQDVQHHWEGHGEQPGGGRPARWLPGRSEGVGLGAWGCNGLQHGAAWPSIPSTDGDGV